jgi:hypothetical protein
MLRSMYLLFRMQEIRRVKDIQKSPETKKWMEYWKTKRIVNVGA